MCPECKSNNITITNWGSRQEMYCKNCGSKFERSNIIEKYVKLPNLFQLGDFTLSSGKKSKWKIECDALTDADIVTLAALIRQMVGPYSSVEGVPTGGLRLAKELEKFVGLDGPHLVVDDVYTSGKSITKILTERYVEGKPSVGAVIFARGQVANLTVQALFRMPECFWPEQRIK